MFWGLLDDIVALLSKDQVKYSVISHLSIGCAAIVLQMVSNQLFRTDISVVRGLDLF